MHLFYWDEVPGNGSERLIVFLKQKYNIGWIKNAKIEKIDNGRSIRVYTPKNQLFLRYNDKKTKVNLIIDGDIIDEFIVMMENGKLDVHGKIRVCITGANGFIGDNLTKIIKLNPNIILVPFKGDLLDKVNVNDFFVANKNIHQIIHLAGTFFGDFDDLLKINVLATQYLLDAAVKNKVKKIIFTSSGAVYGEPIMQESIETDPLKPNTLYGLSKMYAEECIKYYENDLDYVILRFPNVYGKNNNKGVIFNFLKDIESNHEIIIYGNGEQSRNFLHVQDACQAIEKSIFYSSSDIFNISNPSKISINDISKILAEKYEFSVKYREANNNLRDLLLNIDKAKNQLNFEPDINELTI